ncbi:MAG TPA: ABC transporter permease [Gemmataceae bacterium]|nr:ABC transporter permease [Gemmataceae bacterium]
MNKFYRILRTAFRALRRNLMRSALTTLGIIIGVAAVIAMTEIGQGSSAAVQKTIESMGANILLVMPGTASSGGVSFGSGSVITLTPQDADAVLRDCPAISGVATVVRTRTQTTFANKNWVPSFIYGTTPSFLDVRDWNDLDEGEPFTDADVRNQTRVCMIGQTIKRELFDNQSPLGREIRMQNVGFRVIGVLSPRGANMMGMDQDDVILAPWTSIKARVSSSMLANVNQSSATGATTTTSATVNAATAVNSLNQPYPGTQDNVYPTVDPLRAVDYPQQTRFTNIDQILARANSSQDIPLAIRQITDLLHERHHIKAGKPDDFSIRDMTEMSNALGSATQTMTKSLLFVALVSLIVGGVGIMNIMLVSVTERTREIGLHMAVGARPQDILRQFLVEAVVLCLMGGFIGIVLGRSAAMLMHYILGWPIEVSIIAIVAAITVSAGVGIIFGYYPAWKASRLDPIEALRYE